jgi:hypothetical protein
MKAINFNINLPARVLLRNFINVNISPSTNRASLVPGEYVTHPQCPDWGIGQVQSVDSMRVTVNFENVGKQLINAAVVTLAPANISTGR